MSRKRNDGRKRRWRNTRSWHEAWSKRLDCPCGKAGFASYGTAAIVIQESHKGAGKRAYQCNESGLWHLTSIEQARAQQSQRGQWQQLTPLDKLPTEGWND